MSLGIPLIVGPITEWLDMIVVEGCSPGATVLVQTDDSVPTVVAKSTSVGGRDFVPVVGQLIVGQKLVAFQAIPGDTSPLTPSDLGVTVSASPKSHSELPPMAFASKLYSCGEAVWIYGAAPGAVVNLLNTSTMLGTGRADSSGNARFGVTPRLPNSPVSASQEAPPGFPSLAGVPQVLVGTPLPVPPGHLPAPKVLDPIPMGCESSVRVGGVVDGAEVTLERESDGLKETAAFDRDSLWFQLSKPFPKSGDRIYVTQAMPRCEKQASDPDIKNITPAKVPDPLDVDKPCAGSILVHVRNLRPGANLTVEVLGSSPLVYIVPPGTTTWDVPVKALPARTTITFTMEICTFTTSTTVDVVDDLPGAAPFILPELFKCGRAVSVQTTPGAYLEVWGDFGSGPAQLSPRIHARLALRTVGVSPFLTVPEKVWVKQLPCGGGWIEGPALDVKDIPRLKPVELQEPLIEGYRAVLPRNALSGAHVTVWASDRKGTLPRIIGERNVTKADPVVPLSRPLTTDDIVWAIQEICSVPINEEDTPHYSVDPGVMRFTLSSPMEQESQSLNGKAIIRTGLFECRFIGSRWSLVVDAENTDPGYDCGLIVGVDLKLPAPLKLGEHIDIDLAAAGGLPQGLASLGYPAHWTATKYGTFTLLGNPAFWREVLKATATWNMLAAWRNYAPVPDKPEWIKGKDAPPDPLEIPNDPTSGDD